MQRFSFFLLCMICANVANSAYLPVVDVSHGTVSARAAFGEEIAPVVKQETKNVASVPQKVEKKVVARSAKKSVANNNVTTGDVLRPNRPRSDLWARSGDTPLRMPRMDEIAVLDSDAVLPEETLETKPVRVAQRNVRDDSNRVTRDEALNELKQLRAEIARLSALQQQNIARARPVVVRTPIAGESDVKPVEKTNCINVRREVVPSETEKNIAARVATATLAEPKFSSVKDMTKMSPNELKKAFKKTYLSENKHLSTYEAEATNNGFDTISDMTSFAEGFSAARNLSEMDGGVRPLEVKVSFLNGDSGLSRENYRLLSETASIVVNDPRRAIQVAIPEAATYSKDSRKLAARRLAIVEQVLRDTGIAEQRIVPVLSQRDDDVFVLRIISSDVFESLTQQKRNMFGDDVSKKTYKSMAW